MLDTRGFDLAQDRALVDAVLEGREAAIHELSDRLRCVYRILSAQNARLGRPLNEHDLADVAQDTVVIILSKLGEFAATGPLEGWMFRVCSFEFMNSLRRRRRRRTDELVEETTVDESAAREQRETMQREEIHRALDRIGGDEAEALRLKYFEGLTFTEMEARLGVSANTLKARFYRGMQKMAPLLAKLDEQGGQAR